MRRRRLYPMAGAGGLRSDLGRLTSEFLSSPQTCPDLHRMCTAISALPLARIAVAGAESIHVMKVAAEVCPLCEGTGWKSVANGSDRRVTRCDCRVQARSEALLKAARVGLGYCQPDFKHALQR